MYVVFSFYKRLESVKIKWFDLQFLRSMNFWFGSKIHNSFWIWKFFLKKFIDLICLKLLKYFYQANNLTNKKFPLEIY